MAEMIAIVYPEAGTAKQAMEHVDWADFDKQIDVIDACIITSTDGHVKVEPAGHPVAAKAAIGGTVGLLIGALFALPVAGLAIGGALGARRAKHEEHKLDNEFVEEIKQRVGEGGSAIVVLYEEGADTERAGADLLQYGGTVYSSTIPKERLDAIQQTLDLENEHA